MGKNKLENQNALYAEQYVISSILYKENKINSVIDILQPKHFLDYRHIEIYQRMLDFIKKGKPLSPFTLGIEKEYLADLLSSNCSGVNLRDYAKIVVENFKRRKIDDSIKDFIKNNKLENISFSENINKLENAIYETTLKNEQVKSTEQSGVDLLKDIETAYKNKNKILGIKTNISELDKIINGMHGGRFYIIAGRTGMGKSAMMTSIISNLLDQDMKAGVFSLEMTSKEVINRIVSIKTKIPVWKLSKGLIEKEEFYKVSEEVKKITDDNLLLNDMASSNINYIRNMIKRWKTAGVKIIFIDHIGLCKTDAYKENRVYQMQNITSSLKQFSKDFNIPIVGLAQVNRGVEARDNKRPGLSDLRDSGAIEMDSDVVLILYRRIYYLKLNKPEKDENIVDWKADCDKFKDKAEIIIAKNRHGGSKSIDCKFDEETMLFYNRD